MFPVQDGVEQVVLVGGVHCSFKESSDEACRRFVFNIVKAKASHVGWLINNHLLGLFKLALLEPTFTFTADTTDIKLLNINCMATKPNLT